MPRGFDQPETASLIEHLGIGVAVRGGAVGGDFGVPSSASCTTGRCERQPSTFGTGSAMMERRRPPLPSSGNSRRDGLGVFVRSVALCPSAGSDRGYARAAVSLDVLGHRSGVTGLDPSADSVAQVVSHDGVALARFAAPLPGT